jgi:hypothetical protein
MRFDRRGGHGVGPVGKVQARSLVILGMEFPFDGGEGAQEQAAGVGHDGGDGRWRCDADSGAEESRS